MGWGGGDGQAYTAAQPYKQIFTHYRWTYQDILTYCCAPSALCNSCVGPKSWPWPYSRRYTLDLAYPVRTQTQYLARSTHGHSAAAWAGMMLYISFSVTGRISFEIFILFFLKQNQKYPECPCRPEEQCSWALPPAPPSPIPPSSGHPQKVPVAG